MPRVSRSEGVVRTEMVRVLWHRLSGGQPLQRWVGWIWSIQVGAGSDHFRPRLQPEEPPLAFEETVARGMQ